MESTKLEKYYQQMSSDELIDLLNKNEYTDEAKLVAINILEERDELPDHLLILKNSLIDNIETEYKTIGAFNKYLTFWPRFLSAIIDSVIFSLLGYLISYAIFGTLSSTSVSYEFIITILPFIYSIFLHGFFGQTIGKMIMNVKVFDKDENTKITLRQALIRDIIPLSLVLVLFILSKVAVDYNNTIMILAAIIGLINLLWTTIEILTMLTNSKRRALHDYIAGTIVLRIEK